MTGEFQLRAPKAEDTPKLASLGRDTFIETFGPLYRKEDLDHFLEESYSDTVISAELSDPKLTHRVIEFKNELIAFIKVGPVHVPTKCPSPDAAEIWQIYVRQAFLGKGFGNHLMNWALSHFQLIKASEIYVSVFSENSKAIRFYEKYGFKKIDEYDFLVGDQIDLEWIMCKSPLLPK
ncbi:MAG: GNAT family N-acetyltransferase [Akkermansiaceae bacterium]|nr:GNAT family N-acetyltransferase [Akkermansiaceae bacterium]